MGYYSARTIAGRVKEEQKLERDYWKLVTAHRRKARNAPGPVLLIDILPEPDPAVTARVHAERAARRAARLAERPSIGARMGLSWEDLSEEALAEVNLADRALNAARRIAGGSLSIRYYMNEHGDETSAAAAEERWLADEQAWLSAEDVFHEVCVKHGMAEADQWCAPSLMGFDPGGVEPRVVLDNWTALSV